ncbi:MAG: hypothetical protein ACK5YA_00250 [bacterium]
MQQSNPTQEDLKNLTVEELKDRLYTMGVQVDSSRKAKKTYIELILKAAEVGKSKNELFQAPLKTLKNNYVGATSSGISGTKSLPNDLGRDSTRTDENSFISSSNLYQSSYNTNSFPNNNINKQNNDRVFLSGKRENQNKISNKYEVNYTEVSGKYSNINLQDRDKFTGRSESRQMTERGQTKHVSSKSIKGITNLTNSAINDALNNTRIDLRENSTSGIQPFARTPSKISIVSKNTVRKIKSPGFPVLSKFKNTDGEIDYKLLLSVIGGSLSVYAFIYYAQKNCNKEANHLTTLIELAESNQEVILKFGSIVVFAALTYLIYLYIKTKSEYNDYCSNLANICYRNTVSYFELKENDHAQHHITESSFINDLARNYSYSTKKFIEDVYTPYLKAMILEDSRFKLRDLVDEGEIKAFLIYEANEN